MSRRVRGVALFIACWAALAQGATWVVCPEGCPFTDIQEAIAAAAPGDTILIEPGTYHGDVWLKKPLDVRGAGPEPSVIAGYVYVLGATQVTLSGLTIRGGIRLEDSSGVAVANCAVDGSGGISLRGTSATLRTTTVTGADNHGILITLGSRALVIDSTVTGSTGDGIHVAASMADIRGCQMHGNDGYGMWADGHSTIAGQTTLSAVTGNRRGTLGGSARALDRDPPPAPTALTAAPDDWTKGTIAVSWTAPDDLTGIAAAWYTIGISPQAPDDGTRTTGNPFIVHSPPEGSHTLYVWLEDSAGNRDEKNLAEVRILSDRTPPTGEVATNGNARHVFTTEITLVVEATDLAGDGPGSGVASLRLSNDGKMWSPWQPFAPSLAWDLARSRGSATPGTKTVFVELRDKADNVGRVTTEVVLVQSVVSPEPVLCLAFAQAGSRLAQGLPDGTIRLVMPATGQEVQVLRGHTGGVYAAACTTDGKTLVTGSNDNTVRIWDLAGARDPQILRGHTGGVWAVAVSPDAKAIASGASDATIRLWELSTGKTRRTLSGHTGPVRAVAFSPDGKTIASGSDDRAVLVWDVNTGKIKHTLAEHTGAVRSVAFSPDGKLLVSAGLDGKVLLWDMATGKLARTIGALSTGLRAVAFAPDGKSIAAASAVGTVVVWDVATAKERETLKGHAAQINTLAYAPDGGILASGGADKVVRLWEVGP